MSKRFIKPKAAEVKEYAESRGFPLDPDEFIDFYESKGWVVGKSPMKCWQAAVRTWERTWRKRTGIKKPEESSCVELTESEADKLLADIYTDESEGDTNGEIHARAITG